MSRRGRRSSVLSPAELARRGDPFAFYTVSTSARRGKQACCRLKTGQVTWSPHDTTLRYSLDTRGMGSVVVRFMHINVATDLQPEIREIESKFRDSKKREVADGGRIFQRKMTSGAYALRQVVKIDDEGLVISTVLENTGQVAASVLLSATYRIAGGLQLKSIEKPPEAAYTLDVEPGRTEGYYDVTSFGRLEPQGNTTINAGFSRATT
jgi:hypothetical protein